ncbi:MAG: trigger factor [Kiritimatiellae bacterium]|nr:trigger factor [Kiritimatiellia bacterium]
MKTSSKSQDKCQVKLSVELDAEEMKAIVGDVEKVFLREAQLPGFRKGKVPIQLIRKEFADGLKQETQRAMFQKKYAEALKAEGIDEVALADVAEMKYDEKGGSFVAVVETKPKFKLPTYKGLKVEFKDAKVEDAAVKDQLDRLRAAYAKYEDAKEGEAVGEGDFVQIDYEGMVGKKKIHEINPEAKIVGEGKGFWTQVEEGRFLPEILDAVKGMKPGETKTDIKAKFDKESAPDGLKGEKATYTVTLKSFRRRVLPDDAEFAEKAKAESFEKLAATVRESMEKSAVDNEAMRRENEAVELLMKKVDFDVPQSQVRRAMDGYLQELAQRAQYSGLDAEYFEKNRDKILKDAEAAATRQVRLWYVIDAIAAAEKIEAKDEEKGKKVIEFILANAKK